MYLKTAMRYYRLWIYTCNAVLFISVIVFISVSLCIFSDFRFNLITPIKLYHPSFLYAYTSLFVQAGVVQVIGCIGARRLNERLLNCYWLILLALLSGDILVGGIWLLRLDSVLDQLSPDLSSRLTSDYYQKSSDPDFVSNIDALQSLSECCGIEDPQDYLNITTRWQSAFPPINGTFYLPWSCCLEADPPLTLANTIKRRLDNKNSDGEDGAYYEYEEEYPDHPEEEYLTTPDPKDLYTEEELLSKISYSGPVVEPFKWCLYGEHAAWHYQRGCVGPLRIWVRDGADILFVLGICVIAFLKLTFIGILRYEIKEMIQKIKNIQNETNRMNGDLCSSRGILDGFPLNGENPILPNHIPPPPPQSIFDPSSKRAMSVSSISTSSSTFATVEKSRELQDSYIRTNIASKTITSGRPNNKGSTIQTAI